MSLLEKKGTTKICHVCECEKSFGSFIYFTGSPPRAIESTVCSNCNKQLRQIDVYCNKVLEGVFIPVYETPIVKYNIAPKQLK